jgi:hypothetical protein
LILGILPRHQPQQGEEKVLLVLLMDLQQRDPEAKWVVLDGCVLTQVTLTHKHKGKLAFVPESIPGIFNPASEYGEWFGRCVHTTRPEIRLE